MKKNNDQKYLNKTLINSLKILEKFDEKNHELGLNSLKENIDLNKSSVWRLVYTLEYMGYLESIPDSNKYKLGLKGLNFSRIILNNIKVRKIAIAYMKDLSEKLNLNVNLTTFSNNKAIIIAAISSKNTPKYYFHLGRKLPLHATASGKLFLAYQDKNTYTKIIQDLPMDKLTDKTITNKNKFVQHLEEIKEKGYSLDLEEFSDNIRCLAFPIFDNNNNVTASISLTNRKLVNMDEINIKQYINDLAKVANNISYEMGFGMYNI